MILIYLSSMSQVFLPWSSSSHYHRVLDVFLSSEHDENLRIGHLKSKFVACELLILSNYLLTFCWRVWLQAPTTSGHAPFCQNKQQMSNFERLKLKVHMLLTLPPNVQIWSAHHVHWTKLHPNHGDGDLNSMDVKSFAISNVLSQKFWCSRIFLLHRCFSVLPVVLVL